jgi:hypothetical protein
MKVACVKILAVASPLVDIPDARQVVTTVIAENHPNKYS